MKRATRGQEETASASRRARIAAALTGAAVLLLTVLTAAGLRTSAHDEALVRFNESADQAAQSVNRELSGYVNTLRDIGAFVANSDDATSNEFRGFVAQTRAFEQLPSLLGVLFLHRVDDRDVDAFTARMREQDPSFTIRSIGPHQPGSPRLVLTQYAPGKVDLALPLGTDAAPITSVSDLIARSAETGDGVAGSFQADPLLQEIARQTDYPAITAMIDLDFFIGLPVYAPGDSHAAGDTPIGWVAATVGEFDEVARAATAGRPADLGLRLSVDLTKTGVGERPDLTRAAEQPGQAGPLSDATFRATRTFDVEGTDWDVVVWAGADGDPVPAVVPIVLVGGALASVLAAVAMYLRLRARERDRALAEALADREQFQRDILDSVTDAMVVLDADGWIVGVNPAWIRLRPVPGDGRHPSTAPDDHEGYPDAMAPVVPGGVDDLADAVHAVLGNEQDGAEVDVAVESADGHRRWYAVRVTPRRGTRGGAVVIHTDITERKRSEQELELKATRDNLTGLLNRLAFEEEIGAALRRVDDLGADGEGRGANVGVIFIDLDGFKPVNDTYGHAVGDDVLRAVARRLTSSVRTSDRVARLGGDEFVVLVSPLPDPEVAEATAERILDALSRPVRVGEDDVPLGASIGVAVVAAGDIESAQALVDRADAAMYVSKQRGGGRTTTAS